MFGNVTASPVTTSLITTDSSTPSIPLSRAQLRKQQKESQLIKTQFQNLAIEDLVSTKQKYNITLNEKKVAARIKATKEMQIKNGKLNGVINSEQAFTLINKQAPNLYPLVKVSVQSDRPTKIEHIISGNINNNGVLVGLHFLRYDENTESFYLYRYLPSNESFKKENAIGYLLPSSNGHKKFSIQKIEINGEKDLQRLKANQPYRVKITYKEIGFDDEEETKISTIYPSNMTPSDIRNAILNAEKKFIASPFGFNNIWEGVTQFQGKHFKIKGYYEEQNGLKIISTAFPIVK